jgi:DNA-directed RNA polymerase specialized sigma24 family protein
MKTRRMLREAIAPLPVDFREVVVLRELEGLSYKEISPLFLVGSRIWKMRYVNRKAAS